MTEVYLFVRNPMYLAVLTIILGQAVPLGSWWLVLYAVIVLAGVVAFVKGYEEPTFDRTYGQQYLDYRRNVGDGRSCPDLRGFSARGQGCGCAGLLRTAA